jgi:hypothetical protein
MSMHCWGVVAMRTRQARRIYYGLYLNMEACRVNRERRIFADRLVDVTGRFAPGMAMRHDVPKIQSEARKLEEELVTLEAERQAMMAMLDALDDRPAEGPGDGSWNLGRGRFRSTA